MTPDLGRPQIDQALQRFLDVAVAELNALSPDLEPMTASAAEFVNRGGKRLRPLFCIWGHRAVSGVDASLEMIAAASSLELVQACALVHDDLIDASDSRRGFPALHREWSGIHAKDNWAGNPDEFGAAASILIGDLYLAWSDQMFSSSGLSAESMARARAVWDPMRAELMAGQWLDVLEQAQATSSVERALRIADLKSGRYSVERPLLLGAAIAGATAAATESLSSFGVDIGVAFQLRDDLLGVFGDPRITGKPAGDDLREGKRTVLIATALQHCDETQTKDLQSALGDRSLDDTDIERLRKLLTDAGAVERIELMISDRAARAAETLAATELDPIGREGLTMLGSAALHRQR